MPKQSPDQGVEAARAVINAVAAIYFTIDNDAPPKTKPRKGSWTFRKDMMVLGAWYAFLRGETDVLRPVRNHHLHKRFAYSCSALPPATRSNLSCPGPLSTHPSP